MDNDSIDTLLLRHYGPDAPVPQGLERRITSAIRQETSTMQQQHILATRLREQRVSRRSVVRMVALGSAGLGMLSAGLSLLSGPDDHTKHVLA